MKQIWMGFRWPVKAAIILLPLIALIFFADKYGMIPGLKSIASKSVQKASMSKDGVDIKSTEAEMPTLKLDDLELADVTGRPEVRLMNWVWYANAPIFSANGGLTTMKGSLMDQCGINLHMITDNSVDNMKAKQLTFIKAFAGGDKNPKDGVQFVTIMGDGATAYIPAMNKDIKKACGEEYQLKIVAMFGFSLGEDCWIGLPEWKTNPQLLKGSVICGVIGDGDWGLAVRHCGDLDIHVNPDPSTYDPEAVNFVPAPDNDFLKAAQELIIGREVELKVKDSKGNLTGKTVKKKINGAVTWFPGDKQVFEKTNYVKIASTAEYSNQMPCVLVGCDKWMKENKELVVKFLSAALTAGNQIKTYPAWYKFATQLAPKVFCASAADCSETESDWFKYGKPGGGMMKNTDNVDVSAGGTQMCNLADNLKYFGVKGGNNIYKSIYEYFNGVLTDLNPADFKGSVGAVTPYDLAVDLSYLSAINNVNAGKTTKVDYSENKGEVFASRSYHIEFATGSATITPSGEEELEKVFTSLNDAERAKAVIVGYTDNVGSDEKNKTLSLERAKAVKSWLVKRSNSSFPAERFNTDGKGSADPIASNATPEGKAKNRRVQITLTK